MYRESELRAPHLSLITMHRAAAIIVVACTTFGWVPPATADAARGSEEYPGKVCVGWNPDAGDFQTLAVGEATPEAFCPDGYALVGTDVQAGQDRAFDRYPIGGDCCPLPPGALLPLHRFVENECPPSFVATGGRLKPIRGAPPPVTVPPLKWEELEYELRCTRIDTKRFKLGPPLPAVRVGWGKDPTQAFMDWVWGRAEVMTTRDHAPAAYRYALGRKSVGTWKGDVCAGYPWGSLLVKRAGIRCSHLYFSQLLFLSGEPVKIFPSCRALTDPFDPHADCAPTEVLEEYR